MATSTEASAVAARVPVNPIYCPNCTFPAEYCEFAGDLERCLPFLKETIYKDKPDVVLVDKSRGRRKGEFSALPAASSDAASPPTDAIPASATEKPSVTDVEGALQAAYLSADNTASAVVTAGDTAAVAVGAGGATSVAPGAVGVTSAVPVDDAATAAPVKKPKKKKGDAAQEVTVTLEGRRRRNVAGLSVVVPLVKSADVSKAFRKKFASGSSVYKDALGKEVVEVQACDVCSEVAAFLVSEFGVPKESLWLVDADEKTREPAFPKGS